MVDVWQAVLCSSVVQTFQRQGMHAAVWCHADLLLLSLLLLLLPLLQLFWGISDYGAKVVFSSHLWQKNLATVQQRREAAQELLRALDRWVEALYRDWGRCYSRGWGCG